MRAEDARPGDVVLDGDGKFWQRGDRFTDWATFGGPVLHFGEWLPGYGPQGELTLVFRDGQLATAAP